MKRYAALVLAFVLIIICVTAAAENAVCFGTQADMLDSGIPTGSAASGGSSGGGGGIPSITGKSFRFGGVVSLPNNETADEDMEVTITICVTEETDNTVSEFGLDKLNLCNGGGSSGGWNPGGSMSGSGVAYNKSDIKVKILKGENSAAYLAECFLPKKSKYAYIKAVVDNTKYLQTSISEYVLLSDFEKNVINVTLEKPDCSVSGKFTLGNDAETLGADLPIWIYLRAVNTDYSASYRIILKSGETDVEFSVPVRYGRYELSYRAEAENVMFQHISDEEIDLNSDISVNSDVYDVECVCRYNNVVKGVIKLPKGLFAPENGVKIRVLGGRETSVIIPFGESSVSYAVEESNQISFEQIDAQDNDIHYETMEVDKEKAAETELVPYCTISGEISFSEPLDEDAHMYIRIGNPKKDSYKTVSIGSQTGDTSVKYFLRLPGDIADGDGLDIEFKRYDSLRFIMTETAKENEIKVTGYTTVADFNIQLKRKAEVLQGTVKLQDYMPEDTFCLYLKNDNNSLYGECVKEEYSDTAKFVIYGETENISDYSGNYEFSLTTKGYTDYKLHYNNTELLSLEQKGNLDIVDKTVSLNLEIPRANQLFNGTVSLPKECGAEMRVRFCLLEKETYELAAERELTIEPGQKIIDFEFEFLCKNTEYIARYEIKGRDLYPYYDSFGWIYLCNNASDVDESNARTFTADGTEQNVILDLSPLLCSYITGTVRLPNGVVPAEDTYFEVKVTAESDKNSDFVYVCFNEGESEQNYSIGIPKIYADIPYTISCIAGKAAALPSPPRQNVLKDTSFIVPESAPSSGGGGYRRKNIPKDIVQGVPQYYSSYGTTYDKNLAEEIILVGGEDYNADLMMGSIYKKHPRTVGGYFCSSDGSIDAEIQLCDVKTDEVLDRASIRESGNYSLYELYTETTDDVYIRYLYEGAEYYYSKSGNMTELRSEALLIPVNAETIKYGYDVYKNNITCKDFNDRYFEYEVIDFNYPYDKLFVSLYDKNGNKIDSIQGRRNGHFDAEICDALIGFEFSGKTYYFTGKPTYSRYNKEPVLSCLTNDIDSAFVYRIPHRSYRVVVMLDLSEFSSGQTFGKNGEIIINEAYFDYSYQGGGEVYVEDLYINAEDTAFQNGGIIYVGMYAKNGRLIGLREISSFPVSDTVLIDEILPKGAYIKIMPWEEGLKPLSNTAVFFK